MPFQLTFLFYFPSGMHIKMLMYTGTTLYQNYFPLKLVHFMVVSRHSTYFLDRYIRELLRSVMDTIICCNVGSMVMNILVYADDIALLAPSCTSMKELIAVVATNTIDTD